MQARPHLAGPNLAGGLTTEVYPSGREIRTSYDNAGRLSQVSRYISNTFDKTYASQFQYTARGEVSSMLLGNNTVETAQYNSRRQLTMVELRKTDNTLVLGLDYTYGVTSSNNGNVATQAIRIGTGGTTTTINQSYGYDNFNRLHTASETGSWSQTYDFDRYGNRWVSQSTGYTPDATLCPTQQSHISAATNRIVMTGFSYDFSGNQKTQIRSGQNENYDYDSENHLVSVNGGGTGSYVYDADGRRVKKADATGATVFVYDAGGSLIAEYHNDPVPPAPGGGGTSYLTGDHLGSTRIVAKQDGSVKARYDYLPFGEELGASIGARTTGMGYSAADSTKQKFTQKERDSESGLDYFGARYYASAQGRFTSIDPLIASARNVEPQSWNRYTYVLNNPLALVDLDGKDWYKLNEDGLNYWFKDAPTDDEKHHYTHLDIPAGGLRVINVQGATGQYSELNGHNIILYNSDSQPLVNAGIYVPPAVHIPDTGDVAYMLILRYVESPFILSYGSDQFDQATSFSGPYIGAPIDKGMPFTPVGAGPVTVGRWMAEAEYLKMLETGFVQESYTGTTHIAVPADPEAFGRQATPGSFYIEFDVRADSVRPDGSGWGKIIGPNTTEGRLAQSKGLPGPEMPPATNIKHKATKPK